MTTEKNSPEALLERMRAGYKTTLELTYNDFKVDCRLIPAEEMAKAVANAKVKLKVPEGHERYLLEGQAVMKAVLKAATTVGSVAQMGDRFLDMLTNEELVHLHDQYETLMKTCNPEFKNLDEDDIADIISRIKKKSAKASDFYTWQLAAIGQYFLEKIRATGSGAGGS